MAENYCGKSCGTCNMREALCCPGCKAGPGRRYGGDCELAQCCQDKNHDSCDTCTHKPGCTVYQGADTMAERRLKQQAEALAVQEAAQSRAAALGKWLWAYFWLLIASMLPGLLTSDPVKNALPELAIAGEVLELLVALTVAGLFFKMSASNSRYRKAGVCLLLAGVADCGTALAFGAGQLPTWSLLITIPAMIVSFIGEYNEYVAHSEVLEHLDDALAQRWLRLWKWFLILYCAILGSVVLAFILPFLSVLLVLAGTIGIFVVVIFKLIYVYRMARTLGTYTHPAA